MSSNKKDSCSSSDNYKSPASGYSKSILSAIKNIPYDKFTSGSAIRAFANTAVNLTQIDENSHNEDKQDFEKNKMKSVLKIRVGHSSSKSSIDEETCQLNTTPKRVKNKKINENNERVRRSFSCEMAGNPPNHCQKAQSINQINTAHFQHQQNIISSSNSLIGGSSLSIQSSVNNSLNTAIGGGGRSPSAASSICSKDDKLVENEDIKQPKICFSICAKALFACANGKLQELKNLIKEYPDLINYQYPLCYRYSCLHIAAKAGDKKIVHYLIKNGADINCKDESHCTPLHAAAMAGQLEMTNMLIELGADKNIHDGHGMLYSSYLNKYINEYKNEHIKYSNTFHSSNCAIGEEDDSLSQSSIRSHNSSLNTRQHNYTFNSFKKPIGRAVREFLNRK